MTALDQISLEIELKKKSNLIDNTKNSDTIKAYEISWRNIYYNLKVLIRDDWTKEEYKEWRDTWKASYMELSFEIFALKRYISVFNERPNGFIEANYQSIKDRLANVAESMMAIKELSKIKSEEAYQFYKERSKETV